MGSKKDLNGVIGENTGVNELDDETLGDAGNEPPTGQDLDSEEKAQEGAGELEAPEEIESLGEITPEAWKEARAILKAADANVSYSIDSYAERRKVDVLKDRFNDKERSPGLYIDIMALTSQ